MQHLLPVGSAEVHPFLPHNRPACAVAWLEKGAVHLPLASAPLPHRCRSCTAHRRAPRRRPPSCFTSLWLPCKVKRVLLAGHNACLVWTCHSITFFWIHVQGHTALQVFVGRLLLVLHQMTVVHSYPHYALSPVGSTVQGHPSFSNTMNSGCPAPCIHTGPPRERRSAGAAGSTAEGSGDNSTMGGSVHTLLRGFMFVESVSK